MAERFRGRPFRQLPLKRMASFALTLLICAQFPTMDAAEAGGSLRMTRKIDSLEPGKLLVRKLTGGEVHAYEVSLSSNQFMQVTVDQRGIDLIVVVFGPDNRKLLEIDSLLGVEGPEQVSMVADASGTYRIEVSALEERARAGSYRIKAEDLRPATPQDLATAAAERAFVEAASLPARPSPDSVRGAIGKYEQVLKLFESLNHKAGQARALSSIGALYRLLQERQQEIDHLQRAVPLWEEAGDLFMTAHTLDRIGVIYSYIGEMRESIDRFSRELPYWRAISEPMKEANALNNMAIVHSAIGENQEALIFYDKVLQIVRAGGNIQGQAAALNNIGRVYYELGEKQKALEAFNESLELSKLADHPATQAKALRNIGVLYFSLGEPEKALEKFLETLPLCEKTKDNYGKALSFNRIGMVYSYRGETDKAFDRYAQALALVRPTKSNPRTEGHILNNIGLTHSSRGEDRMALDYFNQALPLFQSAVDPLGEAWAYNNIGRIYFKLGEDQRALDYFNNALSINRAVGYRSGAADSLYYMAQVECKRENFTASLSHIDAALEIVEALRVRIDVDELRASYFGSVQDYYNFKIDLLMRLNRLTSSNRYAAEAFQTSERARARILLETLAEAGTDIRQGIDPALLQRRKAIQQSLNALASGRRRSLLKEREGPEQMALKSKEIERLLTAYQELKAQIKTQSPRYAALTQPQPLSLADVQQQVLDDDTLLLEYQLGNERSYLWVVSRNSIDSYELPPRAEIERAARDVYKLLAASNAEAATGKSKRMSQAMAEAQYWETASRLSRMLLSPAGSLLGSKRLLIVTQGALQYLPFAALPVPRRAEPGAQNSATPLIAEHEIISLPSASTLAAVRHDLKGRKPAPKAIAMLADPVFDKTARRNPGAPSRNVSVAGDEKSQSKNAYSRLPRLPFTRQEAKAILKLVPESEYKLALDYDANKATAMSPELAQYRIIHFATHGILDSEHPELSGIVLSLFDKNRSPQDGFLRLNEIYNLHLPVELVVLSACQTAMGKDVNGEGLVGLTRGFMYAGAARVVASLWRVDDRATAELMQRFHKGMLGSDRLSPAQALRKAQLGMLRERRWRMPYYWAGFILQGEWR